MFDIGFPQKKFMYGGDIENPEILIAVRHIVSIQPLIGAEKGVVVRLVDGTLVTLAAMTMAQMALLVREF